MDQTEIDVLHENITRAMNRLGRADKLFGFERAILQIQFLGWETQVAQRKQDKKAQLKVVGVVLRAGRDSADLRRSLSMVVKNTGDAMALGVTVSLSRGAGYDLGKWVDERHFITPLGESRFDFEIEFGFGTPIDIVQTPFEAEYRDSTGRPTYKGILRVGNVALESERRQPGLLESPNPYILPNPIHAGVQGAALIEQGAIMERINRALQHNGAQVVVLHGLRRTGKTSLLWRLPGTNGDYVTAYADMHVVFIDKLDELRGIPDFFYRVAFEIYRSLKNQGFDIDEPDRQDFFTALERDPRHPQAPFLDYLDKVKVSSQAGERPIVLILDEYELVDEQVKAKHLEPAIFQHLRSMVNRGNEIKLLLAGMSAGGLERLEREIVSKRVRMSLLSLDEVRRLLVNPVDFEYDDLAIYRVWRLTGGHPFFVQVLASFLVEYRNEESLKYLTDRDVEEVVGLVLGQEGDCRTLIGIWNSFSEQEKDILRALHTLVSKRDQDSASCDDIRSQYEDIRSQGEESALDGEPSKHVELLVDKEVLEEVEGMYRFRIGIIQRWLQAGGGRER